MEPVRREKFEIKSYQIFPWNFFLKPIGVIILNYVLAAWE